MKHNIKYGFTLVELIVVITILAILATVGFISISQYSQNSRDSVRLTDLNSISKAFEIQKGKNMVLPFPDKKVDIISNGEIIQYQWLLSDKILTSIDIHWGGKDPQTQEYFWYAINTQQNKFQIVTFLENNENLTYSITHSFANSLSKIPKTSWDILGIIVDENSNEIIIEDSLDLWEDFSGKKMIFHDTLIVNTNEKMNNFSYSLNKKMESSCKWLLDNNPELAEKDWYYFLKKDGKLTNTYCDMTSNWGWWDVFWFTNKPNTFRCESWSPDGKTFSTCWNTYGHLTWNKFLVEWKYIISSEMRNSNLLSYCQNTLWASQSIVWSEDSFGNTFSVGLESTSEPYHFTLSQAGEYEITYYLDGWEYRAGECDDNIRVSNMTLKYMPNE